MGLFDIFKPQQEKGMPKSDQRSDISVTLTPLGRQKAEAFSLEGPKFDVLASILDDGTMSLEEISRKTEFSVNKVREICESLARSGCVKVMRIRQ